MVVEVSIIELLKMLPIEIARRAILNTFKDDNNNKMFTFHNSYPESVYVAIAVDRGFNWDETPEGNHYWVSIFQQLTSGIPVDNIKHPHTESVNDHV